jgi:hypothetical protein
MWIKKFLKVINTFILLIVCGQKNEAVYQFSQKADHTLLQLKFFITFKCSTFSASFQKKLLVPAVF